MKHPGRLALLCLACLAISTLKGVDTAFWQVSTFNEFLQGTLSGVSLTKEGELSLAPESRVVFSPEEALALSLAYDRTHNFLYVGTGHQGKVFRVDGNGKASLFFKAQEPDIFAMAVGPDDALYVGTSPEGKIYRVSLDEKSKVFYEPKVKYLWALVFDAQGRLYAGTGDRGRILRIEPSGKGEEFFDSNQTHIMCLAFDRQGNLLAGSVPNGLIYRITPQGKAFALYQATLPEIHELAVAPDGWIYAAALGSEGGKGTPEIFTAPPAPGTGGTVTATVTVTASEGAHASALGAQNPPPSPSGQPSFNRPAPPTLATAMPQGIKGRGSLIEIHPDYTVETIWNSNSESIFGLALRGGHVLFSTDSNGRIFDLDPAREGEKLTLLTETHETLATKLLLQGSDLYIATSNAARIFHLGAAPTREGTYESALKDTKFISRWGVLAWRAQVPSGASLEFFTRSGNSDRPDRTWSDWSGPYRDPDGSPVQSPPARYLQWKVVLRGAGNSSPTLEEVTATYLNQNSPPQIRSLNVSTGGERTSPASTIPGGSVSTGATVTVSTTSSTSFGAAATLGGAGKVPITLSWQADDPNGDTLVYSLYVRATDEQEWHSLKDKMRQTTYTLEPNTLADGKYVARLIASDQESNPPAMALKAEMVSAPFWVDNTPPEVRVLQPEAASPGSEVRFQVEDRTSPLRDAEVAIDTQEWKPVLSDDGIIDSRVETFTAKLPKLEPGEHIVTLRAFDTAGNVGVGKAVIHISEGGKSRR